MRSAESEGVAVQSFWLSVDGFGGSVESMMVEEGKDVDAAAPQGTAGWATSYNWEKPPLSQLRLWHRGAGGCALGSGSRRSVRRGD